MIVRLFTETKSMYGGSPMVQLALIIIAAILVRLMFGAEGES